MVQDSFAKATVKEITHDAPSHIVTQLIGRDRVHTKGVGSEDDVRLYRLGGDGLNRRCFSLMNDHDEVASVVYLHTGFEDPNAVSDILDKKAERIEGKPTHTAFYSISAIRDVQGAGQKLIAGVFQYLSSHFPDMDKYTLSPLRTFDHHWSEEDSRTFGQLSPSKQKREALEYILTGNDPVTLFHMGNGARPIDIKLGAGDMSKDAHTGKMRQHWAMANYSYPLTEVELAQNAATFRGIKKLVRDETLDVTTKLEAVRAGILALVSPSLIEEVGISRRGAGVPSATWVQQRNLDL